MKAVFATIFLLLAMAMAGCLDTPAVEPPEASEDVATDATASRGVEETFTGVATATPATPEEHRFEIVVPSGAVGVNGTLTFTNPTCANGLQRCFRLSLLDPDGEVAATGWAEAAERVSLGTEAPPKPGTWTFVVTAMQAAQTPFELLAGIELLVPQDNVVRRTIELGPTSFYEINTLMEEGATFVYAFDAGSTALVWDIHSHKDGQTTTHEEGTDPAINVTFTAPARGGYSALLQNTQPTPVAVTFEVRGAFRLHSHGG